MPHTIFVWDFDWTVINCNSDEYIPAQFMEESALDSGFQHLFRSTQGDWHACVEGMVNRVMTTGNDQQEQTVSQADILKAAQQMPYLSSVRQALDEIHRQHPKTAQMILSDGNTLFIGAFLNHNDLAGHFTHVVSNKGLWNPEGLLSVEHHSSQYGGHTCERCAANLCKTQALEITLRQWFPSSQQQQPQEADGNKQQQCRPRIVYIGDGANDACPVLNLLIQGDVLLARAGQKRNCANQRSGAETDDEACCETDGSLFGLLSSLQRTQERDGVVPKCEVLEWITGRELHKHVQVFLLDFH